MITRVYVKFDKLLGETSKAYLLRVQGVDIWFPARFCRNFITNKKLGGNMEIPAWLYKEKFGCEPDEDEATEIIIKHIPEKIEVKEVEPIEELEK